MQILADTSLTNYIPIAVALAMSIGFAIVNVGASLILGPLNRGPRV